jgi:predicted DNA-binding transcriptional regulator AlpA
MKKFEFVKMEADMQEKLHTVAELSKLFGVSRQTIHNWNNDGRFPNGITVGDKNTVLVPASDVEVVKREEAEKLIEQLDRLGFRAVPA